MTSGGSIMVKPTRAAIETNLVLNTDRRTYSIELRSREKSYMPSVSWFYPEDRAAVVRFRQNPSFRDPAQRRYRYTFEGDNNPPWRPVSAFDDGLSTSSSRRASGRAKCLRCSSLTPTAS